MKELFTACLPESQILTEPAELQYFGKDVCQQFEAKPALILQPNSPEQVLDCIRVANKNRIPIVPSGGRTGYSAGASATQGEVILSLVKMNRILGLNETDRTISVQAGVTLEAVQNKAKEHDLFYPVDFASRGSCLIGGTLASNAGGIRVIRYGLSRDWVLGLKVVSAAGQLLNLNGSLHKNQTGYDLRQLFIGSEGTLGIILEATLKLTSRPASTQLAFCAFNKIDQILPALLQLRKAGLQIELFEFMEDSCLELVLKHHKLSRPFQQSYPAYALIEADISKTDAQETFEQTLSDLIEQEVLADVAISQSGKQTSELMLLRELIGETANQHYTVHKNDISVPISSIPEFIPELKVLLKPYASKYQLIVFGHIGDGNLHINILLPKDIERTTFWKECEVLDNLIFSLVKNFQGSISAEHGVGLLKKPFLHYSRSPEEIELMRSIKKVFDPNQIMNPGKIF